MKRIRVALSLVTLLICTPRALADTALTQPESHNLGTTQTEEYVLDKGRVSETIIANIAWSWGVYEREDLGTEICTSEKCGRDDHKEVMTMVPKWDFRDPRLINPNDNKPRSGDDLKRELENIINDLMKNADLQGSLTAATADIRGAGNKIEFGNLSDKVLKELAKALEEKRRQVAKLQPKNIKLGHWAPTCYTQPRDFWRNLYALKASVTLVKHRVVTDRGAAKTTDETIGKPVEAIMAVVTLDELKWTDKPALYCCVAEGAGGGNKEGPKENPKEPPPQGGGGGTGTQEKKPTPTPTPRSKPTPTPTPRPTPKGEGAGMAPRDLRAKLCGIVWASDSLPGEPTTVRIVLDPDTIENHPGLKVKRVKLRVPRNRHGKTTLEGMVLRTPDGREQPADAPVNFAVPATPEIALALGPPGEPSTSEVTLVRREPLPKKHRQSGANPAMMPVMSADSICVVHGRFRGDTSATEIKCNGEPVEILAQTPRETWFRPNAVKNGRNQVTVTEEGRTTSFDVFAPTLEIAASRSVLHEGDTAEVRITAKDLEGMAADQWRPGRPDELYDLSSAPADSMNAAGEGKMLLIVKNDSPDVVAMSGVQGDIATVVLTRADIERGEIFHAVLSAHRSGSFVLEAELRPLLAEVSGETLEEGESENTPVANPTPSTSKESEQRTPTDQEQKDFTKWWAAAFGYGVVPELDAKTLAWWKARQAEQDAEAKRKKASDAYNAARQAAIDADPAVKRAKADIANLNRVLSLPQAASEPEFKKTLERKKANRQGDLKQAEAGAEEKWKKTKEAAKLEGDLRDTNREFKAAQDAASEAAKEVPEDARKSIEDAEKHAAEQPPQPEAQEKVMER